MTRPDRFYFIYRAPRERFRQLLAIYGRKPEDRLPDARTFLTRFAAHKSNYLLGFITDPASALFLITWDMGVQRTNPFGALAAFGFGLFAWTLLEYGFHRFVYHKGNTLAHKGHLMHHESPIRRALADALCAKLFWGSGGRIFLLLLSPSHPTSLHNRQHLVSRSDEASQHSPSIAGRKLRRD